MLRYAITDRTLFPTSSSAQPYQGLVARCAVLAREGIDTLLIREKDLPAGALAQLSHEILAAVRLANSDTRVLIASRLDIALAAGLDGVHLSSHPSELTPAQVHALYARAGRPDSTPEPVISLSCHTLPEVRAQTERPPAERPSVLLFAPVFGKSVAGKQVSQPIGLETLHQACAASAIPVLALGGITLENTPACLAAGAAGIAAIRLFMTPPQA